MKTDKIVNRPERIYDLIAISLIIISVFLHALGIFEGYFFDYDESVYAGRAWSFLTTGEFEVSPYTYQYDHPFMGYLLLAFFYLIFPCQFGLTSFGLTACGRIFISIVFGITLSLLYAISVKYFSRRIGILSILLAGFQMGLFELQSKINLDNLGTMMVLLSLYTFLPSSSNYFDSVEKSQKIPGPNMISGVAFGLAVLTKLPMMSFAPAFCFFYICMVLKTLSSPNITMTSNQKKKILKSLIWNIIRNLSCWLVVIVFTISIWFFYALFTDDIFALLLRTQTQMERVSGQGLNWVLMDVIFIVRTAKILVIIIAGIGVALFGWKSYNYISIKRNRSEYPPTKQNQSDNPVIKQNQPDFSDKLLMKTLEFSPSEQHLLDLLSVMGFAGMYMMFLVVYGSYNNYWIPFFIFGSWLISATIDILIRYITHYFNRKMQKTDFRNLSRQDLKQLWQKRIIVICVIILPYGLLLAPFENTDVLLDQSKNQRLAFEWIESNLPKASKIIIQDYFYIELKLAGFQEVHPFLYLQTAHPTEYDFFINPDPIVFDVIEDEISLFEVFDEYRGPNVTIYVAKDSIYYP